MLKPKVEEGNILQGVIAHEAQENQPQPLGKTGAQQQAGQGAK
jgi:hypothetical protein